MLKQFAYAFVILSLTACSAVGGVLAGIATPTLAPTPIDCPTSNSVATDLSGEVQRPKLIVVLVESSPNQSVYIEEAYRIIGHVLPRLIAPGDQIAVFRNGYREYRDAVILDLNQPELTPQNIPSSPTPPATLPAEVVITPTHQTQLGQNIEKNEATAAAQEMQTTATIEWAYYGCALNEWEGNFQQLSDAWESTEEAAVLGLESILASTLTAERATAQATQAVTPIANSFYEGLGHTTSVFGGLGCAEAGSDSSSFSRCVLIVFDNFLDWRIATIEAGTYPIPSGIDLQNIDVLGVMLNCARVYEPACVELQDFWTPQLMGQYGAKSVSYIDGHDIESELGLFLGR